MPSSIRSQNNNLNPQPQYKINSTSKVEKSKNRRLSSIKRTFQKKLKVAIDMQNTVNFTANPNIAPVFDDRLNAKYAIQRSNEKFPITQDCDNQKIKNSIMRLCFLKVTQCGITSIYHKPHGSYEGMRNKSFVCTCQPTMGEVLKRIVYNNGDIIFPVIKESTKNKFIPLNKTENSNLARRINYLHATTKYQQMLDDNKHSKTTESQVDIQKSEYFQETIKYIYYMFNNDYFQNKHQLANYRIKTSEDKVVEKKEFMKKISYVFKYLLDIDAEQIFQVAFKGNNNIAHACAVSLSSRYILLGILNTVATIKNYPLTAVNSMGKTPSSYLDGSEHQIEMNKIMQIILQILKIKRLQQLNFSSSNPT